MAVEDFELLAARADCARLLAACFYQPGDEFTEERLFESLACAAARVDASLATIAGRLAPAYSAQSPEELLVDYTRLFLGPIGTLAQPYESVWAAQADANDPGAPPIVALYAAAGFQVDESFRDLPDHIAAELEFLYALLFRLARAARDGDAAEFDAATALRRRLLDAHLGKWVDAFADAMEAGAQTPFYRLLAAQLRSFIRSESCAL